MNGTKKPASFTLFMTLILALSVTVFSCCACSGKDEMIDEAVNAEPSDNFENEGIQYNSDDYAWITATEQFYPFESEYTVDYVARIDTTMMFAGSRNGVENVLAVAEYLVSDTEGISISPLQYIQLDGLKANNERIFYGLTSGTDGFFYILAGDYPINLYASDGGTIINEKFTGEYSILKYDINGDLIDKIQFSYFSPTMQDLRGIVVDCQNNILVYSSEDYLLLDWDNGIKFSSNDKELQFFGIQRSKGAFVGVVFYNGRPNHGFGVIQINENGEYEFLGDYGGSITPCQAYDDQYLFNDGENIYNYDFETGKRTDLVRWNYGTHLAPCTMVCQLSENAFVYTANGSESLYLIYKKAVLRPENQSIVRVALVGTDTAGGDAEELNNMASNFIYECTEYTEDEMDRLLTEIVAGNGPDLVLFNGQIDTSSAYFEDLYQYIDADEELSRDSFIPGLLSSLEINGQLHELWTGVQILTLAARKSDVGDISDLKLSDYFRIFEENSEYVAFFQSFMTSSNLLSWIATISSGEYIDWKNGTCDFTDSSFGELLFWCNYMAPEYEGEQASVYYEMPEVMLSLENFFDPTRLSVIQNNFGEPFVFVGFPCSDGDGHYYSCAYGCAAAIPVTSKNKDGAWDFIRNQLIESKQVSSYPLDGMPVNYNALIRVSYELKDDELRKQFMELINNTTKAICYGDHQLRKIIIESGQAYLAGDKTLEETVELIQSRVGIFVAEQCG